MGAERRASMDIADSLIRVSIGIEDAVQNAITKAAATIRNMRWFQVVETRGYIDAGKIAYWQVTVKIGFTIEE